MSERSESVSVILSKVFVEKMYHIMVTTGAIIKKKNSGVSTKKKKKNAIICEGEEEKNKATSSGAFHLPQKESRLILGILFISILAYHVKLA